MQEPIPNIREQDKVPEVKPWYAKLDGETPELLESWVQLLDKQLADPNTKLTELGKQDIAHGRAEIASRLAILKPQPQETTAQ